MKKISQVFIFCAGRGERMMPLTKFTPKPLLKVNGKELLQHILQKIDKYPSIERIIINSFYLADEIDKFVKNLRNPKIIISRENEKIETGGGLIYALEHIDLDCPILTLNGDVIWHDSQNHLPDIQYLFDNFDQSKHDFLLGLTRSKNFIGYDGNGDFNFGKNQHLVRDFSKTDAKLDFVYVGMQVLNPKILVPIKNNPLSPKCFSISQLYKNASSIDNNFILNRISGLELNGSYFHVGTPQNLEHANQKF